MSSYHATKPREHQWQMVQFAASLFSRFFMGELCHHQPALAWLQWTRLAPWRIFMFQSFNDCVELRKWRDIRCIGLQGGDFMALEEISWLWPCSFSVSGKQIADGDASLRLCILPRPRAYGDRKPARLGDQVQHRHWALQLLWGRRSLFILQQNTLCTVVPKKKKKWTDNLEIGYPDSSVW